ncbi:DNA polymerase [Taphrina deformans PYCC 5710]|uniref:DNA polymerase n=1 Tax=Taphrina deformans (strain PYCC 5710 / ATCC 11124 / CBS 356.35 / IMI 108563 / JCM 9778 / NBRC 8474) TaxID=1097556 RepID=R4XFG0_TAPDE|nr:DNA polymerase [Taphrina deformans PYCC 5710]|eukprot:CCG82067.1 DNA polymerase [Taphrina deformans PYCC 5710]
MAGVMRKEVLGESDVNRANKRRTMNGRPEKSSFEEDLERLTQEIKDVGEHTAERDQHWARPLLPETNAQRDSISFQSIDIEESMDTNGPTLRLFGVTETGHSVLAHITGFLPYFFVPAPNGFTAKHLQSFIRALETTVGLGGCLSQETALVMRESLYGYQGNQKSPFIKIVMTDPKHLPKLRGSFERGDFSFNGMFPGQVMTFESTLAYELRFMIDTGLFGMSWIELAAGQYEMVPVYSRVSNCQIELKANWKRMKAHEPVGDWAKMAPLRILSFDIECAGRKGIFPEAEIDPVIQIANAVTRFGDSKPFVRNVFTIDTCAPIVGCQVFEHDDGGALLSAWAKFVRDVDPDVIIGYNTANFDLPYLLDRAKALKCADFPYLGRISRSQSVAKDTTFSSKAYGTRESKVINIEGRLQLDMLQVMQRDYKLRSYTLNSVSAHFLNDQKEDIHHSIITDLQNGNSESRRRLAVYCLKDAMLPQRLMDKLMTFVNYTEMARVTGIPFNYLLSRGQQIKVISQLFRKSMSEQLVIPNIKSENADGEMYEGATVIEPERGYYDVPIATLDFSSLYPSIMQAHNLCYTTLLNARMIEKLNFKLNVDYVQTPNGDCFVMPHHRKGLLPNIFTDLLGARKRAKADLKKETDPFRRGVLDGRQLALKVSANSVYGFTGATNGKLPCLAISSSTTAYGREMIERTKSEVEAKYTIANGYKFDAKVIYGDTDSVMVKFGPAEVKDCMDLGNEAADFVSAKFTNPIKLEFEKVYYPYLLINKKRYAGLYWTKPDKHDKMDSKGIETVRRDNCRLVSNLIETALRKMLIDRDPEAATAYVKNTISDLLQNKVDLSNLVITKALSKADYSNKQPHVELAERMRKRDAGSAPALGDRVAYVIIQGAKSDKLYEKTEDPIYVLEHNLPIDAKYYLDNQLAKPLMRIFEPILGDKASQLLNGDHTRTITKSAPTLGGLMKFAVKTVTCMGCKAPVPKGSNSPVCKNCTARGPELWTKHVNIMSTMEIRFARLWTQCQRCQGSLHQDVICTSKDCPIFYMRKKAGKDLKDAATDLDRFASFDEAALF